MFNFKYLYKRIIVHRIERFLRRTTTILRYIFNKKEVEPVFLIGSVRTGSYLFLSYLTSLDEVDSLGEVINPDIARGIRTKFISKEEVLFHIKASLNNSKKRIGVAKLLSYQLKLHNLDLDEVRKYFPSARFIILYRESMTKQFISNEVSEISNVWKVDKSKEWNEKEVTIEVEPGKLKSFCDDIRGFYDDLLERKWIKDKAVLVSYEEVVKNPQKVFDEKIVPFLGVKSAQIQTELKKMNKRPMEEIVSNYIEVKDLLDSNTCKLKY